MNLTKLSIGILLLGAVALFSCTKSKNNTAGKGGNANIYVTLEHHELESKIYDAKVYIKYNTSDFPADNIWDDSVVCTHAVRDTSQTAVFTNLKNGEYYLYALGQDSLWKLPVKGGSPYTLSQQSDSLSYSLGVDEYNP